MIELAQLPELSPDPPIYDPSGLWQLTDWVRRPMGPPDERVRYWWCEDGLVEVGLESRRLSNVDEAQWRWFATIPRIRGSTSGRCDSQDQAEQLALQMAEEILLFPRDFRRELSERAYEGLWVPELQLEGFRLTRWHRTTPGTARARYVRVWVEDGPFPRRLVPRPHGAMVRQMGHEVSWKVDVPGRGRDSGTESDREAAFAACERALVELGCSAVETTWT
jgi:hypothetical protein